MKPLAVGSKMMRSRGAGRAQKQNKTHGASDGVGVRDCGDRGFVRSSTLTPIAQLPGYETSDTDGVLRRLPQLASDWIRVRRLKLTKCNPN